MVSLLMLLVFLGAWQLSATAPSVAGAAKAGMTAEEMEYQKMMGKDPGAVKSTGFPPPMEVGKVIVLHLSDPFYDKGPNDKGIGIQLMHSLGRVGLGFLLAVLVALPVGFMIGMSPLLRKAFDPFVQVLKPISPLAWMPLALYTLKDSDVSGIFVIFICSVILPAAAPTIVTGMRISMGIAWLVIVAAEMLVGGTGVGYFVWNEWNNLSLVNVIFAVLVIGVVGMLLDLAFAQVQKAVTYVE